MRDERIHIMSKKTTPAGAAWVLYWMEASLRCEDNLALRYALGQAHQKQLPLLVVYGLTVDQPNVSKFKFSFVADGLKSVAYYLAERDIPFLIRDRPPPEAALELSNRAALTVTDMGYTRLQLEWRRYFADRTPGPAIMVEDNICLPVSSAYPKSAVGARVLRPRISQAMEVFLSDDLPDPERQSIHVDLTFDSLDPEKLSQEYREVTHQPGRVKSLPGGEAESLSRLDSFIENQLDRYPEDRNNPVLDGSSGLSPYLHFGQISVREVARRALIHGGAGSEVFLEELLVRRELAINFTWYNPDYESPEVLPRWAVETLDNHASDRRPFIYEEAVMEAGQTGDPYWNACQLQMIHTGNMHGYMRMYWGKKVIEWSADWRQAWSLLMRWNDFYELDGEDPNGYAGVAWCFGMHDRPWANRDVFGSIRYMNDKGLKRKFDADAYVQKVNNLIAGIQMPENNRIARKKRV